MNVKSRTVLIALLSSLGLAIVKLVVGLISSSIAVMASALDSFADVCSMGISLIGVRSAEKPADENHQFGHGKAEPIAGLFQASLIAISAGYLIYKAFHRMIEGYVLQDEGIAIAIIILALAVSYFLAYKLKQVGKRTESAALAASALNFGADVWTNAGVLLALGLELWARIKNADPIISIIVSLYIIISAIRIGHTAISQLMDRSLPSDMLKVIDTCIRSHGPMVKGYHRLRTRGVGPEKEIEFHLEIDRSVSFDEAHNLTETIIADIKRAIPGATVTVHTDPR